MHSAMLKGLVSELEKIALVTPALHVAETLLKRPTMSYWGYKRTKAGAERHRKTMRALEEGYPASWPALGIVPK